MAARARKQIGLASKCDAWTIFHSCRTVELELIQNKVHSADSTSISCQLGVHSPSQRFWFQENHLPDLPEHHWIRALNLLSCDYLNMLRSQHFGLEILVSTRSQNPQANDAAHLWVLQCGSLLPQKPHTLTSLLDSLDLEHCPLWQCFEPSLLVLFQTSKPNAIERTSVDNISYSLGLGHRNSSSRSGLESLFVNHQIAFLS